MRKVFLTIAMFMLLFATTPASAQIGQFEGSWINADSSTGGITRLEINRTRSDLQIHAWGACTPQDCDWGEVIGFAYGPSVSSDLSADAEVLSAVFETTFSETILVIHPLEGERLQVEVMTRFTDQSGRSNYASVEIFDREEDETSAPQRFFLHFTDAYLVHQPGTTTLQITAEGNVLSYGGDWQVIQMRSYLYHMRQNNWRDFYWKVNTSREEVYRVTNGTFGQLGGNEETLNIQVDSVGSSENPTRFFLRFTDAYLVHQPGTTTLQIIAERNVLSYGGDWQVIQMRPFLYHMRQNNWRDFYWKVNTSREEVYRVTNGTFGQLGGDEELLDIRVEPVY